MNEVACLYVRPNIVHWVIINESKGKQRKRFLRSGRPKGIWDEKYIRIVSNELISYSGVR